MQSSSLKEIFFRGTTGLCIALPLFLLSSIMNRILREECMSDGDIKLVFSLGICFHLFQDLVALLLACLTGLLLSLFYLRRKERMIPFGPCICTGFLIVMLMDGKLF